MANPPSRNLNSVNTNPLIHQVDSWSDDIGTAHHAPQTFGNDEASFYNDVPQTETDCADDYTVVPEPATVIAVSVFGFALRQARGRRRSGRLAL
jgi:hypothetical protein